MITRRLSLVALTAVAALALPAAAQAKLTAGASVETKNGKTKIVATIVSDKSVSKRKRPAKVSAKAGGKTYTLTRSGKVTGKALGVWKSKGVTGAEATTLQGLAGQAIKLTIRTKSGAKSTLSATIPVAATPTPAPTPAPAGTPPAVTPGGAKITATRDDAAGQAIFRGTDLLLERYKWASSGQFADYWRIWFYANGQFRQNTISYNTVSGESCTDVKLGTWVFKEGYTFPEAGGGSVARVTLAGQLTGDEILLTGNSEPNNVYIGQQLIQFERNPQIAQNC
ncbi:MAG: hypothetical protein JHC95_01210 [Solirubrobacteraceae bacterium]|nr:hypothetical protein [Solirubrobacteraceae bacterium]